MVSSPCANCPRIGEPKDKCIKNCQLLHALQSAQVVTRELNLTSAIDYTEEGRFTVNYQG